MSCTVSLVWGDRVRRTSKSRDKALGSGTSGVRRKESTTATDSPALYKESALHQNVCNFPLNRDVQKPFPGWNLQHLPFLDPLLMLRLEPPRWKQLEVV